MSLQSKQDLRQELAALWQSAGARPSPPQFEGRGKAAERLRRQECYRRAKVVAVMPDPVLLQVRINLLADNKTLIALTPGLKQGMVRLTSQDVPTPLRSRELRGGALFKAGRPIRLPKGKVGPVDLVVGACLAADLKGRMLGDGRGLWDLSVALLGCLGCLGGARLAALVAEDQIAAQLPHDPWDASAQLLVTPQRVVQTGAGLAGYGLAGLPDKLAGLPVVQRVRQVTSC